MLTEEKIESRSHIGIWMILSLCLYPILFKACDYFGEWSYSCKLSLFLFSIVYFCISFWWAIGSPMPRTDSELDDWYRSK